LNAFTDENQEVVPERRRHHERSHDEEPDANGQFDQPLPSFVRHGLLSRYHMCYPRLMRAISLLAAPAVLATLATLATPARAEGKQPRYFVVIRGIIDEGKTGLADEMQRLFAEELKRRPEVKAELPGIADAHTAEPAALDAALKKEKLRGLELSLKILSATKALDPPPSGKQYNVLKRGIKLSVFGNTIPQNVMAVGGDGEASAGAEVNRTASDEVLEREGKKLVTDVAKDAIKQAVDLTFAKLERAAAEAAKAGTKKKPKIANGAKK
jgi:hypothetical protein